MTEQQTNLANNIIHALEQIGYNNAEKIDIFLHCLNYIRHNSILPQIKNEIVVKVLAEYILSPPRKSKNEINLEIKADILEIQIKEKDKEIKKMEEKIKTLSLL